MNNDVESVFVILMDVAMSTYKQKYVMVANDNYID